MDSNLGTSKNTQIATHLFKGEANHMYKSARINLALRKQKSGHI